MECTQGHAASTLQHIHTHMHPCRAHTCTHARVAANAMNTTEGGAVLEGSKGHAAIALRQNSMYVNMRRPHTDTHAQAESGGPIHHDDGRDRNTARQHRPCPMHANCGPCVNSRCTHSL